MELDEIVKLKDKGNEYFKKNEFKNAIQQYSKAIEVLSGCDDTVRSQFGHILHTNRSISYFQLKNFQKSLEDATRAVQINDKWEKAHYFRAKSYFELGQYKLARSSFAKCLDLSPSNKVFDEEFEEAERKYIISYYSKNVAGLPVQVRYQSRHAGKAVFARDNFTFGETVFEEKPVVSHRFVSSKKNERLSCSHCMRSFVSKDDLVQLQSDLEGSQLHLAANLFELIYPKGPPSFIRCACETELYCSKNCKEEAWNSYHQVLCPGKRVDSSHPLQKLRDLAIKHERTNFMIISRIFGMAIQNYKTYNDKERGFEDFDAFLANPEPSPGDVEAVELLKHALMHHAPYDDLITLPNWRELNGMIIRNTQTIIPVSDFHFFLEKANMLKMVGLDTNFTDFVTRFEAPLSKLLIQGGSGLFQLGNSMNHSCRPNCVVASCLPDFRIKIIALRSIQKGDELCFSYLLSISRKVCL